MNHDDLPARLGDLVAWRDVRIHRSSAPPDGTLTLADFAAPSLERVIELLLPETGSARKATITVVHEAMTVIVRTVLAPFAFDGLHVMAPADQLGMVRDGDGESGFWVGTADIATERDAEAVGATVATLLLPVLDAVCARGRFGRRGVELVALDVLSSRVRRLGRRVADRGDDWGPALIRATGLRSDLPVRRLSVQVDDGPPVPFPVPRVCCVLSSTLGEHACPTCPKFPDDEARARAVREWVSDMDDEDFFDVTGRRRVR